MEKIAVLFPSADADASRADSAWLEEIAACEATDLFFSVLYNESAFMDGEALRVSNPAPSKKIYCIRRGRTLRDWMYEAGKRSEIEHALRRFGYVEALRFITGHDWSFGCGYPPDEFDTKGLMPETASPYRYCWRGRPDEYSWSPGLRALRSLLPVVAKNDEGTLCHPDGTPVVIRELPTWGDAEMVIRHMSALPIEGLGGACSQAPMWFQRHLDIAKTDDGTPIECRVFFLEGRVMHAMSKFDPGEGARIPMPPEEVLTPFCRSRCFRAVDYALGTDGRWWVLKTQEGEQAAVPAGGSPAEFYAGLAEEILRGPDVPAWAWCLVADVVASHKLGEAKTEVEGARHFAPGTRVVFVDAYWGLGGERCTVVGVPKYSDSLVGVTIRTELLENFRCERVDDEPVMRALATNRLREPFERERNTRLWGGYKLWGQTEEIRKRLEGEAERLNRLLDGVRGR